MWIKIDDHFDEHPKLAQVGPLGWGIWLAGLAYCNRNLTDGFIPRSVARNLGDFEVVNSEGKIGRICVTSGMTGEDIDAGWVADLLVDAGLWQTVQGGFRVHDYTDYQWSKERVLAEREAKGKRQARWRDRRVRDALLELADVQSRLSGKVDASTDALVEAYETR